MMNSFELVSLPHPSKLFIVEPLDYPNPYNFHRLHRHDYFEIILISEGQGSQTIDLNTYKMTPGQVSIIYPGQTHLMQRDSANGLILQFRKDIFEFIHPLKHYHLYSSTPIYTPHESVFDHMIDLTRWMQEIQKKEQIPVFETYKAYSYLQILLLTLAEQHLASFNNANSALVSRFLSVITGCLHKKMKVTEYCAMIGCNAEKLNKACKEILGKNALELIHEEVMIEIKRLLHLEQMSLKEIAFELDFDSQQNFSAFVKTKTGMSPSELQQSIRNFH